MEENKDINYNEIDEEDEIRKIKNKILFNKYHCIKNQVKVHLE